MTVTPWDRLPDESSNAYRAALTYFNLGSSRSLDMVADATVAGTKRVGAGRVKAGGNLQRWSRTHRWGERAAAWDRHRDAETRSAIDASALARSEEQVQRWAGRQHTYPELLWTVFAMAANRMQRIQARENDDKTRVSDSDFDVAMTRFDKATRFAERALAIAIPSPIDPDRPAPASPVTLAPHEAKAMMRALVTARESPPPSQDT